MHTWSRDTSVTKLSGPARDGSSTRVFAPLTFEIVNDKPTQKGDGKRLTELRACTREFLAISLSMETSMVSLAGRRWSELGKVEAEVVISEDQCPARGTFSQSYNVLLSLCTGTVHILINIISCFSSHSVLFSSSRSHLFLLVIPTGAFLPLPTLPVSS